MPRIPTAHSPFPTAHFVSENTILGPAFRTIHTNHF